MQFAQRIGTCHLEVSAIFPCTSYAMFVGTGACTCAAGASLRVAGAWTRVAGVDTVRHGFVRFAVGAHVLIRILYHYPGCAATATSWRSQCTGTVGGRLPGCRIMSIYMQIRHILSYEIEVVCVWHGLAWYVRFAMFHCSWYSDEIYVVIS